jgi:hypothetical protein
MIEGKGGKYYGVKGEPLFTVPRNDGALSFINANKDDYYVGEPLKNGRFEVTGPHKMKGALAFNSAHYSQADVDALQKLANKKGQPLPKNPKGVTVSDHDKRQAREWRREIGQNYRKNRDTLSDCCVADSCAIKKDEDGIYRGPDGQPLVYVKGRGSQKMFLDLNASPQEYYLQGLPHGSNKGDPLVTKGPLALPKKSWVKGEHTSPADTKFLSSIANGVPYETSRSHPLFGRLNALFEKWLKRRLEA